MFRSNYPQVRPDDYRGLSQSDALAKLIQFTEVNKYSEEWKNALIYLIKHEQEPRQFDMLHELLKHMLAVNKETMSSAITSLYYDGLNQLKSVASLFMLLWFLYQSPSSSDGYYVGKELDRFVQKKEMMEKDILQLEDVDVKEYPPRFVEQIRMCVEALPLFLTKAKVKLNMGALDQLLNWALVYPVTNRQQAGYLNQFCKALASTCTETDYYGEFSRDNSNAFIMSVLRKCNWNFPGCDNLTAAIENLPDIAINCIDQCKELRCLPNEVLISAFVKLTRGSFTVKVLKLLNCLSFILMRESDFYTLKKLYKEVVLPRLIRFGKGTTTAQKELQRLARLYVEGFISYVKLTPEDLDHFFFGFNLVKRNDMQFWIKLACTYVLSDNSLQPQFRKLCSKIITNNPMTILTDKEYHNAMQNMWEIDRKDLEERKKYLLKQSKLSGIVNSSSRCYMISVLQALNRTGSFPQLIKEHSGEYRSGYSGYNIRCNLLYELQWLLMDLKDGRRGITPDRVKSFGPECFRDSQGQQDCGQYLSALFDSIEKDVKLIESKARDDFLKRFKEIFEVTIRTTITCEKCGNTNHTDESGYIHAIDLEEKLAKEQTHKVNHTCDKCKLVNPNRVMKKQMIKLPETLLVNIKRFSFKEDRQIKRLESCDVARTFDRYQLLGFICHIGRNPLCGHYVFYCRKDSDPLTWLEFNDQRVSEFTLESPDEKFQQNFPSANTPYLLIYQQRK